MVEVVLVSIRIVNRKYGGSGNGSGKQMTVSLMGNFCDGKFGAAFFGIFLGFLMFLQFFHQNTLSLTVQFWFVTIIA